MAQRRPAVSAAARRQTVIALAPSSTTTESATANRTRRIAVTTARPIKSVPIATAGTPPAGAANRAPSAGRATAKLMTNRTTSRRPQAASPWVIATAYPTGRPDLIRPRATSVPATTSGSNTTWMASIARSDWPAPSSGSKNSK